MGPAQAGQTRSFVDALPDHVVAAPAGLSPAAHPHEMEFQVAELGLEGRHRLLGADHKGRVGHINQMAVLVLAVQADKAGAAHLFVPSAEGVIAAVGVVAVLKV